MPLVTVTGRVTDHSQQPITGRAARLFFRPSRSAVSDRLLAGVESAAALVDGTGSFTVQLDNAPGISYTPVLAWLRNPLDPENTARGYEEWSPFYPGGGGNIRDLVQQTMVGVIGAGYGPPPAQGGGYAWIDMSDQTEQGVMLYAPKGTV